MGFPPPETELLEQALNHLRVNTGLEARIEAPKFTPSPLIQHYRPGARIVVTHKNRETAYWVEIKKQVDRHAALLAFNELATHTGLKELEAKGGGLLVTRYLTPELAERCRKMRLQFLDAAGNAYLDQDGLFVLIQGQKLTGPMAKKETPTRAFDRTGLRVVFALLAAPNLLNGTYRDIAKTAGVALGTVGWILTDLRERGFIVDGQDGIRRWIDPERAMRTWATNYPMRLRNRLHPKRYRAADEDWWKQANPAKFGGQWGGEIAAAKLRGNLVPNTATIYIHGDRHPFLAAHRLRADETGTIEVLDAFWDFPEGPNQETDLVPTLLVFADLEEVGNPRTYEEAKRIHDDYLART